MKRVYLITDGACIGNPGRGGWACILRYQGHKKELFGFEEHTTNNRMELRAVVEGLNELRAPCEVTVITDSQYVRKGITEWLDVWKKKGWRKRKKGKSRTRDVLNKDLWLELERATEPHAITWEWVKGHAGHMDNSRCDYLALMAAQEQVSSPRSFRRE